jgi:hypothetical protein
VAVLACLLAGSLPGALRPSPELVINMIDGRQQLLSQYKGKPVALVFITTT